jgi:hypothetical protein
VPWVVDDYIVTITNSKPAGATGKCTISLGPVPAGYVWRVEGIAIRCTSPAGSEFFVYDRTPLSTNVVPAQGATRGDLTFADMASPITIKEGQPLVLQWTGVTPGIVAYARVQVVQLRGNAQAGPTPVAV